VYFRGTLKRFQNSCFVSSLLKKYKKGFPEILIVETKNSINPDGEIENENDQKHLRESSELSVVNVSSIGPNQREVARVPMLLSA
jgi:hypothetical protein